MFFFCVTGLQRSYLNSVFFVRCLHHRNEEVMNRKALTIGGLLKDITRAGKCNRGFQKVRTNYLGYATATLLKNNQVTFFYKRIKTSPI